MSDPLVRPPAGHHRGEAHASPYPVSRLAPPHDLVDVARQIQEADQLLGTVAHARLSTIAAQMAALKAEAARILEETRASLDLHRARCSFVKRPGHVYHAYRRDTETWLSMIGPDEWGDDVVREHLGTYRLELDQRWTRLDVPAEKRPGVDEVPPPHELVGRLLGG
jgi:hypothetical protein